LCAEEGAITPRAALIGAACVASFANPAPADPVKSRDFSFTGPDSDRVYDARLLTPRPGERNGVSVLFIAGGAVTDLHWTVPGGFEHEGEREQFTIDGRATRDADTIGAALAEAGFVVMQWSSVRRGDPLRAQNAAMAQPVPYGESVTLAARAMEVLREQPEVDPRAAAGTSRSRTRPAARRGQIRSESRPPPLPRRG